MLLVLNFSDVLTRPFHEHGAWPMAWPGLRPSRPQAVFEVSDFLTRGLALAWPQAADSGRRRPWLGHGLRQPIDTENFDMLKFLHVKIFTCQNLTGQNYL
jgi:hypothetical protein